MELGTLKKECPFLIQNDAMTLLFAAPQAYNLQVTNTKKKEISDDNDKND
jgi:hypothetical protein